MRELSKEVTTSREKSASLESQLTETNSYLSSVAAKLEEEVRIERIYVRRYCNVPGNTIMCDKKH